MAPRLKERYENEIRDKLISHFKIGNTVGDPGQSLPIPLDGKHRRYRDFAGDFSGNDLALIAEHRDISMADAARAVASERSILEMFARQAREAQA